MQGKPKGLLVSTIHTLRQWRKLKRYGQRELARLAGLSHTAVSDLEQGKTKGLPATWRKLAAALGVDVTPILEYRREGRAVLAVTLNAARRQLSTEEQRGLVRRLRFELGWSYSRIEQATGIPKVTCIRWCNEEPERQVEDLRTFSGGPFGPPENLRKLATTHGLDGKRYPMERLDDEDRAALVERARALRDAGATLEQIANELGVALGTISSWLNRGARIQTTLSRASRVSGVVGLDKETSDGEAAR
jgi:transcriptional regulator with XRE-family HTH domain